MSMQDNAIGGFSAQQALATGASTDALSTNVYDALTAVIQHGGHGGGTEVEVRVTAIAGTTPNFRARYVAADNAALTTNPIILDDTGASPALVAADIPWTKILKPNNQATAKRYYGVIYNQSGNNDNTATVDANVVLGGGAQTAMLK